MSAPRSTQSGSVTEPAPTSLVWDFPTRLFHLLLILGMAGSYLSIEVFDDIFWHSRLGLGVLGLMIFRLGWGLWGGHYARFSSFWPSLSAAKAYWRQPWAVRGHNPMGAWSVFALLGLISLQALLGLASSDDISFEGPLARLLPGWAVSLAGELHETLQGVLLALMGLHVLAVVFYQWRGEALISAMVHGHKKTEPTSVGSGAATGTESVPPARPATVAAWRALLTAALAGGITAWIYLSL